MKYFSIDIETTGTDSNIHDILEFACVYEDTNKLVPLEELPKYQAYIYNHDDLYHTTAYCGEIHYRIFTILKNRHDPAFSEKYNYQTKESLAVSFGNWLQNLNIQLQIENSYDGFCYKLNAAGKNAASFDIPWLYKKCIGFGGWKKNWPISNSDIPYIKFEKRVIDPALFYTDFKTDEILPDTELCLKRAGMQANLKHEALQDALDVIELIRRKP